MAGDPNSIIFVFGSNLAGIHGVGAAEDAVKYWGAIYGLGIGRQGNSYAIPTKNHHIKTRPLKYIEHDVKQFLAYAWAHPELDFQVTRIGCGYAGYMDKDIAPMFKDATPNVHLPLGWREWDSTKS